MWYLMKTCELAAPGNTFSSQTHSKCTHKARKGPSLPSTLNLARTPEAWTNKKGGKPEIPAQTLQQHL